MAGWTWAAASRRGTAHADAGGRRQDAMRIAAPGGGEAFLALVACDGAGSANHGGEGASIAAWTLAECARAWLFAEGRLPDEPRVTLWMSLAGLRIAAAAFRRGLAPGDFATTVVMALSDGAGTVVAHVGDGAVVARRAGSVEWLPLSWPEHGEHASTTYFLTDAMVRLRFASHGEPVDRLAVLTDGLERIGLDFARRRPHAPFFDAMFGPLAAAPAGGLNRQLSRQLGDYLDSERVVARTDDDKTLILAARL